MYGKKCPWCWKDNTLTCVVNISDIFYIYCPVCDCCGPQTAKTEEEAWELFWRPFHWAEGSGRAQALNEHGILEPPNDVDDDVDPPLL